MLQKSLREKEKIEKKIFREKEKIEKKIFREKEKKKKLLLKEKEKKRKRILNAAITLFGKKGFEKTTVEDITYKAKVAKGTFYNFFNKKEDVLIYFLDREIELSREEIDQSINSTDDFLDQFELLMLTYLKHIFRNKDFAKIIFKERVIKWGTKDNRTESRLLQSLYQLIDQAKQKNQIKPRVDTEELAAILFSLNTMYIILWLNGAITTRKECAKRIKEAVKIAIDGAGT